MTSPVELLRDGAKPLHQPSSLISRKVKEVQGRSLYTMNCSSMRAFTDFLLMLLTSSTPTAILTKRMSMITLTVLPETKSSVSKPLPLMRLDGWNPAFHVWLQHLAIGQVQFCPASVPNE